ncbi:MAG: hypothetical protein K8R40_03380 [Anaerolineaceae bacterium]|nr:hypothetical protein [Anaerolineaceae bacterium]
MRKNTFVILILFLLAACSTDKPQISDPTQTTQFTVTATPIPVIITLTRTPVTKTPTPTSIHIPTLTITPTFTPVPDCSLPNANEELYVVHDDRIHWAGMPIGFIKQVIERLEDKYLDFYHFQQSVYYQQLDKTTDYNNALDIIEQTSGGNDYINPFVLLAAVGESLEWKPPANGDLYGTAKEIRITLHQHYADFAWDPEIRSQNPKIANAATYAIYAYFDSDREKVRQWCEEYVYITGQDPALSPFDE